MRRYALVVVLLAALTGLGPGGVVPPATGAVIDPAPGEMVVRHSIHNDTSRPLSELAWEAAGAALPDTGRTAMLPGGRFEDTPAAPSKVVPEPRTETGVGIGAAPAPSLTFEGLSNDDNAAVYGFRVMPPDTTGDVGPNHYVQATNLLFRIWDKSGTPLIPRTRMSTLFAGFGGNCEFRDDGDPIVLYDQLANRWMLTQFAVPAPSLQCIAISSTPDPLGTYHRYSFSFGSFFNDYPHFGLWPDAYYASFHLFQGSYAGLGAAAFDRDKMLVGDPATMVLFNAGGGFRGQGHGALPSDLDGMELPPAGAPNIFVDPNDGAVAGGVDRLDLYSFHVDFDDPDSSSFELTGTVATPEWDSDACGFSRDCIPQPGTTQRIDALSGRGMYRVYYRNRGGYQQWIGNVSVDDNGLSHVTPMWYEIRDIGNAVPNLWQFSIFSPDQVLHRWMGSIATDRRGNMALGYSVSSATVFPGIRYTVREYTDPLNTMQAEATMTVGSGSQLGGPRWGDYSTMAVDPSNDCTFWYTQEYGKTTGSFLWYTRVGAFTIPSCLSPLPTADLRISQTVMPDPSSVGTPTTFTATITNDGPATATSVQLQDGLPPNTTFGSATPSQGTCGAPVNRFITCDLGSMAPGASATFTLVVTPTVEGRFANAVGVTSLNVDPNLGNNSSVVTGFAVGIADLAVDLDDLKDPVLLGENIAYSAKITNKGPNSAFDLVYEQTLPPGTALVDGSPCTSDGSVVTCTKATLGPLTTTTFTFEVTTSGDTPLVATTGGGVTSVAPDPVSNNNFRTEKTLVIIPGPPPQVPEA